MSEFGEAVIEVSGLSKRFGPVLALDGMSFTVQPGRVTGFVGPNGAGKSTTMRVILGLDAADAGTALVGGRPYATLRHPLRHVGSLLDAGAVQPGRSARNHLLWLAHSQGLTARRVDEVIARAGLGQAARRKAGGFSLGMRQRLGIAAALLGDPMVIMLDEPFNGMDPEGIVWMRGFLRSLADGGRAVLVSSHLMSELQDRVRTACGPRAALVLQDAGATAVSTGPGLLTISGLPAERIVALLAAAGVPFSEVSAQQATLEQAYLELTRDAVEYRAAGHEAVAAGSGQAGEATR
jgi:ABC-2 type transport system ATP-binding protein